MGSSKNREVSTQNQSQTSQQSQSSQYNQGNSGSSQTIFDPRSAQEQSILNQYQGLGESQRAFLDQLMAPGASPYTMNQADQDLINQAYAGARNRMDLGFKDAVDYLSASRGMSRGSTPVSQQALDRYGAAQKDLESANAQALLDYGMQGTQARLAGAQALPAGLGAAFMPMFNERMAGGRQTYNQSSFGSNSANSSYSGNSSGRSDTTQYQNPSIMSQIQQGMGLGAGLGLMAGGAMMGNPMMAMGGMGMMSGNPYLTASGMTGMTRGGIGSVQSRGFDPVMDSRDS